MDGQLSKRENCAVVVHRRYLSPPAWFVRMWPKADIPTALTNVRFQGNSGHAVVGPRSPDPLQTSGASLRSRPRSISGEGGGDPKSRNLIEKCSLRLVARNTAYMLRLLTPCRPLHRCFPHQEAAIWIPVKSFVSPFSQV
jgi:hypothetical protein